MSKCECGHEVLSLYLVFISFCQQNTKSQESTNAISNCRRFVKVVVSSCENFAQRFGARQEDPLGVEQSKITYNAVVGDFICPWKYLSELDVMYWG